MTKEQLAELRRLAEAATDGPWIAAGPAFGGSTPKYLNDVVVDNPDSELDCLSIFPLPNEEATEDMEYIAAFNPVTAIALLDRITELEKEIAELNAQEAKP
jgi:hypothetical protein